MCAMRAVGLWQTLVLWTQVWGWGIKLSQEQFLKSFDNSLIKTFRKCVWDSVVILSWNKNERWKKKKSNSSKCSHLNMQFKRAGSFIHPLYTTQWKTCSLTTLITEDKDPLEQGQKICALVIMKSGWGYGREIYTWPWMPWELLSLLCSKEKNKQNSTTIQAKECRALNLGKKRKWFLLCKEVKLNLVK